MAHSQIPDHTYYPPPPSEIPLQQESNYYPPPQQDADKVQQFNSTPSKGNVRFAGEDYSYHKPAKDNTYPQQARPFVGAASTEQDDVGTFNGGSYRISHRDSNTMLTLQLAMGCPLTVKSGQLHSPIANQDLANVALGALLSMTPTVTVKGTIKVTMKKVIAGSHLMHSNFTGPGEVVLVPAFLGDICSVRLADKDEWSVGKDAFLACTQGIHKDLKRQGIGKALFSGEGLFVYKMSGNGIVWLTSFGAIIRKDASLFRGVNVGKADNICSWSKTNNT
jgi:uncharacterized protein (AIM24 family)